MIWHIFQLDAATVMTLVGWSKLVGSTSNFNWSQFYIGANCCKKKSEKIFSQKKIRDLESWGRVTWYFVVISIVICKGNEANVIPKITDLTFSHLSWELVAHLFRICSTHEYFEMVEYQPQTPSQLWDTGVPSIFDFVQFIKKPCCSSTHLKFASFFLSWSANFEYLKLREEKIFFLRNFQSS